MDPKKIKVIIILILEAIVILLVNLFVQDRLLKYKIIGFSSIFLAFFVGKLNKFTFFILIYLIIATYLESSVKLPYAEYMYVGPLLAYSLRVLLSKDTSKL